ncbi:MAG: hypothetical protein U0T83_08415 [Bacteriovoracaceae bacterium]
MILVNVETMMFQCSFNDTTLNLNGNLPGKVECVVGIGLKCSEFPPLKLKFDKNVPLTSTPFLNARKLKMVTRCNENERARWVNRELAIYKLLK